MITSFEKRSLVRDIGNGITLTTPHAFLLPQITYTFPSIEAAERGLQQKEKFTRKLFQVSAALAYVGLIPLLVGVIGSGLVDLSVINGQGFEHFLHLPFPGNNLEMAGGTSAVTIGTLAGAVALRENARTFEQYDAVQDFKQNNQHNMPIKTS